MKKKITSQLILNPEIDPPRKISVEEALGIKADTTSEALKELQKGLKVNKPNKVSDIFDNIKPKKNILLVWFNILQAWLRNVFILRSFWKATMVYKLEKEFNRASYDSSFPGVYTCAIESVIYAISRVGSKKELLEAMTYSSHLPVKEHLCAEPILFYHEQSYSREDAALGIDKIGLKSYAAKALAIAKNITVKNI